MIDVAYLELRRAVAHAMVQDTLDGLRGRIFDRGQCLLRGVFLRDRVIDGRLCSTGHVRLDAFSNLCALCKSGGQHCDKLLPLVITESAAATDVKLVKQVINPLVGDVWIFAVDLELDANHRTALDAVKLFVCRSRRPRQGCRNTVALGFLCVVSRLILRFVRSSISQDTCKRCGHRLVGPVGSAVQAHSSGAPAQLAANTLHDVHTFERKDPQHCCEGIRVANRTERELNCVLTGETELAPHTSPNFRYSLHDGYLAPCLGSEHGCPDGSHVNFPRCLGCLIRDPTRVVVGVAIHDVDRLAVSTQQDCDRYLSMLHATIR